jgi:hypothetical protein
MAPPPLPGVKPTHGADHAYQLLFPTAVSVDNLLIPQLENFRLKVFRAGAEHLNFHKAAEQLFLTQPAVTLQIKAL